MEEEDDVNNEAAKKKNSAHHWPLAVQSPCLMRLVFLQRGLSCFSFSTSVSSSRARSVTVDKLVRLKKNRRKYELILLCSWTGFPWNYVATRGGIIFISSVDDSLSQEALSQQRPRRLQGRTTATHRSAVEASINQVLSLFLIDVIVDF